MSAQLMVEKLSLPAVMICEEVLLTILVVFPIRMLAQIGGFERI